MSARRWLRHTRLVVGSWIMGGGWFGVVMRLWLIRDRAKAAITEDGHVVLADCKALADALYAPIPGHWKLTIERDDPAARATPAGGTEP